MYPETGNCSGLPWTWKKRKTHAEERRIREGQHVMLGDPYADRLRLRRIPKWLTTNMERMPRDVWRRCGAHILSLSPYSTPTVKQLVDGTPTP